MAFIYGKHGSSGELVYSLSTDERIDQDAYGMLRNNAVEHIVPVTYKQLDDRRELHYDVGDLHVARDYFERHVFNRQQYVALLTCAAEAFSEADEYMLVVESFSNSLDNVYVDDQLNLLLTYVPVTGFSSCSSARVFLIDMRRCVQPDRASGDLAYLSAIDDALRDADGFTVGGFKKLLSSLTLKPKRGESAGLRSNTGFAPVNDNLSMSGPSFNQQESGTGVGSGNPQPTSPSAPASGVSPNGMAVPPGEAFGALGGMAVPGMDNQHIAVDAPKEKKKGLFGRRKKEKGPQAEQPMSSRQAKKQAKEAEKAAKAAAKAEKRRRKGGAAKPKSKKGAGVFSLGKSKEIDIPMGPTRGEGASLPFAVPGQGEAPSASPDNTSAAPGPSGAGYAPEGLAAFPDGKSDALTEQGSGFGRVQQMSAMGDQYSDQDFGITEVYGISTPVKDGLRPDGAPGDASVKLAPKERPRESPGLPVTAYLRRTSTGEKRLIDKTPFRVGRKRSEVDFHIADKPKVSRVHAVISFDGGRFFISDNESVNHTAVNGNRLGRADRVALSDGDCVEMGDESFEFIQP